MNIRKIQMSGVSSFIRNKEGKILIIQRAAHDTRPGIWECPGGGISWGEDPTEAIKREIKEECGLDVKVESVYKVLSWTGLYKNINRHMIQIVFECKVINEKQNVVLSREHSAFKWIERSGLKNLQISKFLRSHIDHEV